MELLRKGKSKNFVLWIYNMLTLACYNTIVMSWGDILHGKNKNVLYSCLWWFSVIQELRKKATRFYSCFLSKFLRLLWQPTQTYCLALCLEQPSVGVAIKEDQDVFYSSFHVLSNKMFTQYDFLIFFFQGEFDLQTWSQGQMLIQLRYSCPPRPSIFLWSLKMTIKKLWVT